MQDAVDGQAASPTVLIVDDAPENLVVLGELLQPAYRVRAVNSGERALRAAHSAPRPDIILLDIMMPDVDGYAVLRQLQADAETRDIPVIFLTARNSAEDEQLGLDMGAVDYITKPFNAGIVLARVRAQLELKRARDRLAENNRWLEAEVERRMHENSLVHDMNIKALAYLAELRDMETGHHIRRTQSYVALLARRLSAHPRFRDALAGRSLDMIVKAAPLHDVGKVGIPDHILLKPGRLDDEEMAVMRTHAALGAEAIERAMQEALADADDAAVEQAPGAFRFLRVAQEIAVSHHEKWDGSGYPHGIEGEAIPVSGRLMALADVYDALTCRRVYKEPMPFDRAAAIIIEGRGGHFDPDVVDAFVADRASFEEIARRLTDPAERA